MSRHIAVLCNPSAGKGRARAVGVAASARLRGEGVAVRDFVGESVEETRSHALHALADRPRALVVVGGDGTLSAILDIVSTQRTPVVIVPAGTGNDLARALGLPLDDPADAALLALTGRPRAVDIGRVTSTGGSRLFLTVAALGFDARVSDRTDRLSWPRGRLRYYLALLIELARLRPVPFRIAIDEGPERAEPGILTAVGNTASYGGGMPMCRGALPDDGLFDVVQVAPLTRRRLVRVFPLLLKGRHLSLPEVARTRARTVSVTAPDLLVYADGERVAASDCVIDMSEEKLIVLVPA